ncbi:hypothetical protein GL263_22615 [Streptomyces durbertensis]|uniref:Uncharacterized protein n=1 Tax=Streptomyces durbertensis TaxID=2448886 RepID=A0ABR6ELX6_9ACTN|nr:hypothetical protein [Streptomyces durbertensis]MBB1246327.1 hypothetical protein [Streptomyces durbertensis]
MSDTPRRTRQERARRAALADAARGFLTDPYQSWSCRIRAHDDCTDGQERPSPCEGVHYDVCTCPCHGRAGAEEVR